MFTLQPGNTARFTCLKTAVSCRDAAIVEFAAKRATCMASRNASERRESNASIYSCATWTETEVKSVALSFDKSW